MYILISRVFSSINHNAGEYFDFTSFFFFFRLLYDEQGHLVALETKDQKLYVAADHVGSPLLIFRPDGTVDKAVKYSAYGLVLSDSSPIMSLPVGYRGGLNIGSGLVMIDQRVYDVLTHQWLNPDWERLQNELNHPNDLYVYRYVIV